MSRHGRRDFPPDVISAAGWLHAPGLSLEPTTRSRKPLG
jgi:hypothetical protein